MLAETVTQGACGDRLLLGGGQWKVGWGSRFHQAGEVYAET